MAETGRIEEPNCPFCDIRQFQEQLIAEVEGFYIIATLGQITDGGYVLIVPKRHVPCMGIIEQDDLVRAEHLLRRIDHILVDEYTPLKSLWDHSPGLMFEHGIVGQTIKHAHIHVMPEFCDLTPMVKRDFPNRYFDDGLATYLKDLGKLYKDKQKPYLLWRDSHLFAPSTICWDPPAPSQYLRTITAEALGRPERANWRTMDPGLDKRLWSETVRRLKPYF